MAIKKLTTKSFIFMLLILATAAVAYHALIGQIDDFASTANASNNPAVVKSALIKGMDVGAFSTKLGGDLKNFTKDSADTAKWQTGSQPMMASMKALIDQMQTMADKIQIKINNLKQNGKDTTQLEKYLANLKVQLTAAKDKYNQAQAQAQSVATSTDAKIKLQNTRLFINAAGQRLNQAINHLNQISGKMQQLEAKNSAGAATSTQ